MAGAGSRFSCEGYLDPKPLIQVHGKHMIEVVINNIKPSRPHRFIFICQKKHIASYKLDKLLEAAAPGSILVEVEGLTEGAACTVLKAEHIIDNDNPLMIANSDQYVRVNINEYIKSAEERGLDGLIMTMTADDPKWSFVSLQNGSVTRVVEKEVISNEATVGIYNFTKGSLFVSAAKRMINKNLRVNKEFYVAPSYNEIIAEGKRIGIFNIGTTEEGMHGLGTPADLQNFLKNPASSEWIK